MLGLCTDTKKKISGGSEIYPPGYIRGKQPEQRPGPCLLLLFSLLSCCSHCGVRAGALALSIMGRMGLRSTQGWVHTLEELCWNRIERVAGGCCKQVAGVWAYHKGPEQQMLRCSKDASLWSSNQEQRNSNVDLGRWVTQQLLK